MTNVPQEMWEVRKEEIGAGCLGIVDTLLLFYKFKITSKQKIVKYVNNLENKLCLHNIHYIGMCMYI